KSSRIPSDSIWMGFRFGVHHDPCGLTGGCTQHHHSGVEFVLFHIFFVHERYACSFSFVISRHFTYHGMGIKIHFTFLHSWMKQARAGGEICIYLTASVTLAAEE